MNYATSYFYLQNNNKIANAVNITFLYSFASPIQKLPAATF